MHLLPVNTTGLGGSDSSSLQALDGGEHKVVTWQLADSSTPNHCPVPALQLDLRLDLVVYIHLKLGLVALFEIGFYTQKISVSCLSRALKGARQAKIVI